MRRGIIVAPGKVSGNGAHFQIERGLTPEELRYFLLYWDRIVIPTTNIIHLAVPEEDELLKTGVVSRPRLQFSGTFNGELMAKAQIFAQAEIAGDLIRNDRKTDWVLHQIGSDVILPDKDAIEKQLIRVDLVSCLPVPSADVSLYDILDFKERRADELKQLHQVIDEVYKEILSSPDPSLKTKQSVSKLSQSLAGLDAVSKERWKSTTKFNFSADLNLGGGSLAGAAIGAVFDFFTNPYSMPLGAALGSVLMSVNIKAGVAKTLEASKGQLVLAYISSAQNEEIVSKQ